MTSAESGNVVPDRMLTSPSNGVELPQRKKQKRNKPTLSCEECVERKTKCDRIRPKCVACVKRQSDCRYSEVANLIASADARANGTRRASKTKRRSTIGPTSPATRQALSVDTAASPNIKQSYRSTSASSAGSSPLLLSNVAHTKHTPSHVFGIGKEHPFANYWTCQGGLPEVIGVLPSKDQADILVTKYFDSVDPVYPMINKQSFYREYEHFWSLPTEEKYTVDAALLALHYVVYAMGLQFMSTPSPPERAQLAEFYVSAANQALRIFGYLSRTSIRSIQTMVLMCYFLMNDNHASDSWAFGGVLGRQAYAMGLHRDPDLIAPHASSWEKQQRRKVWQAVLFQDTFLTVLLKLPPNAIFSDVRVESLTDEPLIDPHCTANSSDGSPAPSNPMSISSIAPSILPNVHEHSDHDYIRSMWRLANLVQKTVCEPRSLNQPLTCSPRQKVDVISSYKSLHASFSKSLTTSDRSITERLAISSPRRARQNLFFRSNYWHCMMILQADENEAGGVQCDIREALEAARMAIGAFFELWEFLNTDAGVWWVFQHRVFEEALMAARLLAIHNTRNGMIKQEQYNRSDSLFMFAKMDVSRTLEILENVGAGAPEMQKTRTEVLRAALEEITW
ncbi:hypothetical protein M501DRAFT_986514 [Patellaria atrata CBS 101060]|uniref:Zn(2)-C6 fungal-type domain-containing protein n=1 Tax=Patellaria atrata CBS 101060 TaxID=1346257 RepID=A0A9P4VMZ0_9PEZI|nr:hypothetical protein M501DRAFT_986514 [Patellaria atrata CBS 101060]